ncbi:regulator of protease activity HflC (stomatin/prohibitin superfamily) [Halomonas cerina]|uniref:Regulator of protease activity HflC (Stomatin/prohibitin superfamily) n=1 Tax=Halomonas cerina TaxID=447424 RepID=A0A839V6Y0_9GAMM|nr:regulator of protease activity HflC (stomatin/prohibitin superfamily) [Halomonas cerina]
MMISYLVPVVLVLMLLAASIRILPEYKRGVVFFLGRFQAVKGPGLFIIIPGIQKMEVVDLRVITMDVPEQDVISQDNVTVKVNAVLYFRVVDPEKAIIQVEHFVNATSQLAQTTLRSVLGKHDLDEMLSERDKLNDDIQEIIDASAEGWGIKVANVEIKHVDLDESMIRAIARQAEAERERRAKVIHAEGELQASKKLVEAAHVMSANPAALQLRYLQTMNDMSNKNASTIVVPLPIDLMEAFRQMGGSAGGPTGDKLSGAAPSTDVEGDDEQDSFEADTTQARAEQAEFLERGQDEQDRDKQQKDEG